MYKIADEKFQGLCKKYRGEGSVIENYAYHLNEVKADGTALFSVPYMYQTNELIMIALETSEKPIHLMTRWTLESCISKEREELSKISPKYKKPISDEERNSHLRDLVQIINYKYDNSFSKNYTLEEYNLYTFIDFFSSVCEYYGGMDTICYVYLYRGDSIPIRIKFNGRKRNFKLIYNSQEKVLHLCKVSADEYKSLWTTLAKKLESYYGKYSQLDEYCWEESPTEQTDIPILQDGEYYETFMTIEEDGITFDYTHNYILSVPKDLVDFAIPEGVVSIPEKCFLGNKTLRRVKFPSSLTYIPKAAFMDCESLEEIDLSLVETSEYSKVTVGSAAFCNCKSLRFIDMSKLKLEDGAELTFAYCLGIEDISELELPGWEKTQMNFFHCENLTRLVRDPYAVYGDFDLAYCRSLRKIRIPRYAIPTGMLCGCDGLESVEIEYNGHTRKEFGDYCFAGCKSLVEIDTLKGGAKIGKFAFADCDRLSRFVINKKDEWYTVISETSFEGSPQVQLEWANESYHTKKEPISDYWKRKGIEAEIQRQNEIKNGLEAKSHFIKVLNDYHSDCYAIGKFFEERGRYIGMDMIAILKYDLCSWEEYLKIGRLFYECIPFSNMDDDGDIRTTLVSWAKCCSMQAYLKAPIHNKFDAIQQIYSILKIAHSSFEKQNVVYDEKSREYAEIDVLNTYFDYNEFVEKVSDEQKASLYSYISLSDIRMSYLMQLYLLTHLFNYNTIQSKEDWNYDYAKKEIEKLTKHINKFGIIAPVFIKEVCRYTWQQFIKDDIEKNFEEMGEDNVNVEVNETYFLSFDFSTMEIYRDTELIDKSCARGENLLIPNQYRRANNQTYDDYDEEVYNGYGRYSGSYAQDEMGWSDDDIDTVLDGDPDAYWNID